MNYIVLFFIVAFVLLYFSFLVYFRRKKGSLSMDIYHSLAIQIVTLILSLSSSGSIAYYSLYPDKLSEGYRTIYSIFAVYGAIIITIAVTYHFLKYVDLTTKE